MKRISAVICELNPLHEGHKYVFSKAGENSDLLIAVMSGNFVQRGETAVYDKFKRARMALLAGADLVVELPFPYCASSAEFFARAGVRIAEGVGADRLCFGSECGDIMALRRAGEILKSEEYRSAMTVGRSAAIRSEALKNLAPDLPESLLESPNDILGAEYCRNAAIETVAIKRISAESASSIRSRCVGGDGSDMLDPKRLFQLEYNHFRTLRGPTADIAECGGGVFERLLNTAFLTNSADEWQIAQRTKQYTNARLRRAALYALCSVTAEELHSEVAFTRVLGANSKGREHLSAIRKARSFPVITNHSEIKEMPENVREQVKLANFADNVYALCTGTNDPAVFLKTPPIMVE